MKKKIFITLLTVICTLCLAFGLVACADDSGLSLISVTANTSEDGETLLSLDFLLSDGTEFTVVDGVNGGEGTTLESITENYGEDGNLETYTIALSNGMSFTIDASTALSAIVPNISGGAIESYSIILSTGTAFTVYLEVEQTVVDGDGDEQSGTEQSGTEQGDTGGGEQSGDEQGGTEITATEGLYYELSEDEKYYILSGIGDCTETDIIVPAMYNNLPVTEIADWAFSSDETITSITIHADIEYIGEGALYSCKNLASITVESGNANYKSVDGNLYTADGATLLQYALGSTAEKFTIPDGVTTIADAAFANSSLSQVTIPESVESLSYLMFAYSRGLESVVLPTSVTYISSYAFEDCISFTEVYYLGSEEDYKAIEVEDNEGVYYGNDVLLNAKVYIYVSIMIDPSFSKNHWHYDDNGNTVINADCSHDLDHIAAVRVTCQSDGCLEHWHCTLCNRYFSDSDGQTKVKYSDLYIQTTGEHNLKHYEKTDPGCTTYGNEEYWYCSDCNSYFTDESGELYTSYSKLLIAYEGHELYAYTGTEATCTTEGLADYWYCPVCETYFFDALASEATTYDGLTLPKTAHTYNNNYVCVDCGYSITVSEGLNLALSDDESYYIVKGTGTCTDTDIVIPPSYNGKPVKEIASYAFMNKTSLTSITIPDSVTTVAINAFAFCTGLTSVYIGSGVTSIPGAMFSSCMSVTYFSVSSQNPNYQSIDGDIYSKDGKTLVKYATGKTEASVTISNNVTSVGGYAFYGSASLVDITIGNNVTELGEYSFWGCTALERIITSNNSLKTIGAYSFYTQSTSKLISIILPTSIKSIGENAFYGRGSLESVFFRGSSESAYNTIAALDEDGVLAATKVYYYTTVAPSAESNDYWHYGSDGNAKIWTNEGTEGIVYTPHGDGYMVTGYTGTETDVVIPTTYNSKPVVAIDSNAFYKNTSITSVRIGKNVTTIGETAFSYCTALATVYIGDGVKTISTLAFYGDSGLKTITIGSSVAEIANSAFYLQGIIMSAVYYNGTQEMWNAISINTANTDLTDADIVFNG